MSVAEVTAFDTLDAALEEWARWAIDSGTAFCAGFPKRSVVAAISDLHLSEYGCIKPKPGVCPFCKSGKTLVDLQAHIRSRHPERYRETANGRQTRTPAYYSADDHPLAEAVESAIVYIGRTRPDLYHVIVADRLWIVPSFRTGWDQKWMRNFESYRYMPQRMFSGESEAEHKKRMATAMGMSLAKFYRLREQAHVAVGVALDLNRRYDFM